MAGVVWVNEVCEGGKTNRFLAEKGHLQYCDEGSTEEPATLENTTLDQLVSYCEGEAENANYHSLSGLHWKLAALIGGKTSLEAAKAIFFEIAKAGGLHEMGN